MNFEKKMKVFQEHLKKKFDVALVSPGLNFYYLTGLSPASTLERLFLLVVPADGNLVIIAPKLYQNELKSSWISNIVYWEDKDDPYEILKIFMANLERKTGNLLIEDSMPSLILINIMKYIGQYRLEPISTVISKFRIIKNEEDLKCMKRAADIVDRVFYDLIEKNLEDKTEIDLATLIDQLMRNFGAEGTSFETIVASGANGANPHHTPGNRKLQKGDLVILDYGARYQGYCSDITRTIAIGHVSDNEKKVYEIVKDAQENAFRSVKAGVKAKEVDYSARKVIERCGYGAFFSHRTGHGIGLDAHEEPYITSTNERILENGMVFTIEPGIYLSGKFGVRIEDDVLVKKTGERLTKAKRELVVL